MSADRDFKQYLDDHRDLEIPRKICCSQHPGLPLCPCKHKGYWKLEDIAPALKLFFQVSTQSGAAFARLWSCRPEHFSQF